MEDAGIRGDTISFTAAINACARAGDVQRAEKWMAKMLEASVEPNAITFNAVIAACAKAHNGKRCEEWLERMRRAGVQPNSFTYNSASKPFIAKGDFGRVERFMQDLSRDGLPLDDFCLTSLLHAYGNANPKPLFRAEAALQKFAINGKCLSNNAIQALQRLMGRADAQKLCDKYGLSFSSRKAGQHSLVSVSKGNAVPLSVQSPLNFGSYDQA